VPRSWVGPHRVELKDYRFWYRGNRRNERLDVDQLRAAFLAGPEYIQQVRSYRADRVAKIAAGLAPMQMLSNDALIVHVLPRNLFSSERLSGTQLREQMVDLTPPGATSIRDIRFNLEGIVAYSGADAGVASAYTQLGRHGAYEGVRSHIVNETQQQGRLLPINEVELQTRGAVWSALKIMHHLKFEPPFTIFLSLIGVQGAFYQSRVGGSDEAEVTGFDRNIVLASEILIHNIPPQMLELNPLLFPLFDEIANAAGWTRSPH